MLRRILQRHAFDMTDLAFAKLCHNSDCNKDSELVYSQFLFHFTDVHAHQRGRDEMPATPAVVESTPISPALQRKVSTALRSKLHHLAACLRRADWKRTGAVSLDAFISAMESHATGLSRQDLTALQRMFVVSDRPSVIAYVEFLRFFRSQTAELRTDVRVGGLHNYCGQ